MRIFALMLIGFMSLFAEEIVWSESYAKAAERAKAEGKNIYLKITTEDCRWCRRLEKFTLTDEDVVARMNAEYIAVEVTRDKDEYPSHLKAKMVPMSYFLTPEGRVAISMPGFWDMEDFLSIMDDADKKFKKMNKEK